MVERPGVGVPLAGHREQEHQEQPERPLGLVGPVGPEPMGTGRYPEARRVDRRQRCLFIYLFF